MIEIFIISLIGLISLLILYARWNRGILESMGVPIVESHWLFGSLTKLPTTIMQKEDIRRFRKFGEVYGVYEGRTPILHVCNADLVKRMMVQDYEHFSARASIDLGHPIANEIMDYLPTEKWKMVRNLFSPAFSTGRIKHLNEIMGTLAKECVDQWVEEFDQENVQSKKILYRSRIVGLMVDYGAQALCGIQLEDRMNPNNKFANLLKKILCEHVKYNYTYNLLLVFPFLKPFFPKVFPTDGIDHFATMMDEIVNIRMKSGGKQNDVLEILVDIINRSSTPEFKRLGITKQTGISQILEQFFTMFDSTGTTLSLVGYHLAKNPEAQEKILQEFDEIIMNKFNGEINGESIKEMEYLEATITESLRLNSPFIRPERLCTKQWKDEETGLVISKGQIVVFPNWAIHRNPKYFPEPDFFKPERFLPENKKNLHPYAFNSFGHGPKNCIGIKLAYSLSKIVLCNIFKHFQFEETKETEINFKKGTLFVFQYGDIQLNLVRRN